MKPAKPKTPTKRKAGINTTTDPRAESRQILGHRLTQAFKAIDQVDRRRMYEEFLREQKIMNGPAISVAQLATLVDARVHGRFGKGPIDGKTLVAEIESTLDLIEMCQWLLVARKREWKSMVPDLCGIERSTPAPIKTPSRLSEQEEKEVELIRRKKYPLKFERGLSEFGSGMRSATVANRNSRFSKFFANCYREWDWSDAPPGALGLFSIFPSMPAAASGAIGVRTRDEFHPWEIDPDYPISADDVLSWTSGGAKWPDAESLLWVKQKWAPWLPIEEKINKGAGGSAPREKE